MSRHTVQREWIRDIPHARPKFPNHPIDLIKYYFWRVITPFHPHVRDLLLYMQLLRHEGRQNYLLGRLAPGESVEGFIEYLLEKGYGNHFIAWQDDDQLASLRYTPDFKYQYHIRIFKDGEVRGHFEYTPECHMVWHMQEVGMESRREEFLKLFGNRVIPA